jgi:DNA-binding NtrC family response regulator
MRSAPGASILVVDDEVETLKSIELLLLAAGFGNVELASDPRSVLPGMAVRRPAVVVLDLMMPVLSGEEVLASIRQEHPSVPVVVVTAAGDLETAVRCMRAGAYDFLTKPLEPGILEGTLRRALERGELEHEVSRLRERVLDATRGEAALERPEVFEPIVTSSRSMIAIFQYLEAIAGSPQPVLVTGESGTGKELIARAIHDLSRPQGPFVPVNVAGLDDTLFSDALFGHRRGAFTGADTARAGLVEKAGGGTLFLDEIGDLSAASQVKLLRLLQDGEYYPLGSDLSQRSDAALVLATNLDIGALSVEGRFRKDLYYRLRTHHVHLPPLRLRRDDLPLLVECFVEEAAAALQRPAPELPPEVMELLAVHDYPGNIRELRSLLFDAVSRARGGAVSVEALRAHMAGAPASAERGTPEPSGVPAPLPPRVVFPERLPTLREMDDLLVAEALSRAGGNQTQAARLLGISHQALNKRLQQRRAGV